METKGMPILIETLILAAKIGVPFSLRDSRRAIHLETTKGAQSHRASDVSFKAIHAEDHLYRTADFKHTAQCQLRAACQSHSERGDGAIFETKHRSVLGNIHHTDDLFT